MAPRHSTASTQTFESGLEVFFALKRAVVAQGAELESLRIELPRLQAQAERTLAMEATPALGQKRPGWPCRCAVWCTA